MQSKAATVKEYLAELPEDRRAALEAIRTTILKNLPKGYEEGMLYGMIGYYVPHSVYPPGFHCDPKQPLPFVCLASQKNYMLLSMTCDAEFAAWFREAWTDSGKKLARRKPCVRFNFKSLDDVPLKVVGQAIRRVPVKRLIDFETDRSAEAERKAARKKAVKKKAVKRIAKKRIARKR